MTLCRMSHYENDTSIPIILIRQYDAQNFNIRNDDLFLISRYTKIAQNNKGGKLIGMMFIVIPIAALIFGSDEPAMQGEQAALVMTAMIVIGIIMIVNSNKKTVTPQALHSYESTPPVVQQQQASKFCPYCGTAIAA